MNDTIIKLIDYRMAIRRRCNNLGVKPALVDHLAAVIALESSTGRAVQRAELRTKLGLNSAINFPELEQSGYVTIKKKPFKYGQRTIYKSTKEGQDLATKIFNPTKA